MIIRDSGLHTVNVFAQAGEDIENIAAALRKAHYPRLVSGPYGSSWVDIQVAAVDGDNAVLKVRRMLRGLDENYREKRWTRKLRYKP